MVMAVGVPRCSWRMTTSDKPALLQDRTSSGRTRLPRFSRIAVGIISKRISLEKAASLLEGDREVVTSTRGSAMPERAASTFVLAFACSFMLYISKRPQCWARGTHTLVVQIQLFFDFGSSLVILVVFPQVLIVGNGPIQLLSRCQTLSQFCPFFADLGIF